INGFESADWILGLFVLASMLFHLLTYEREREAAGTDFAITLSGALYIGWLGAYLISLRTLPNGLWWFLVALPSVWIADSGAYFIGRQFGRHRLCPRLSPKKTWEGYIGGIISGVLGGALLAALVPNVDITPMRGVVLGLILSVITPLGDLGESMFKRQVNIKDSSNLIPGHGGAFDRVDSWLWGGIISYYIITWLFI
ncbi:MAG: phosphatidate cytidylyltransferase, partial [Chloroflexota bacterium]|nr:phosphatidate cytidylyltransferase [Chloroflexota bacterium]